jgi:flavin reductase (DIM6/NTAB) family NADH-FMN oxidoreductase RutF
MSWIDDQRPDDAMAGAFEAIGPEPVITVGAESFRDAMSRLGAAVHVVTTAGPGGKTGFTATAVCSVSDAPPTLLVCLNRRSHGGPILRENKVFCVNTLGADCEAIADVFAGRTGAIKDERFVTGTWSTLKTGAPVLETAVVAFDCQVVEIRPVGSHNVIFGAVVDVKLNAASPALLYHNRAYKRL